MGELSATALVVPTIGRPSLQALLRSLRASPGPLLHELIVVDDRPLDRSELGKLDASAIARHMRVLRSGGRGPAAARNAGWRAATTSWIAFLDDDVEVTPSWRADAERDLALLLTGAGGVAADVHVPLPSKRAPTDWERNVAGLSTAAWITADMLYRRDTLEAVGGFDERFRHAYREDADLAMRVCAAGYALRLGTRRTRHPVRPADRWISVRLQRGNADDVLMRALHGSQWRALARAPRGRFRRHALTVAAAASVPVALALHGRKAAAAGAAVWLGLWADFALARILPGPKTADEIVTMTLSSAAIPFAAVYHALSGMLTLPQRLRGPV